MRRTEPVMRPDGPMPGYDNTAYARPHGHERIGLPYWPAEWKSDPETMPVLLIQLAPPSGPETLLTRYVRLDALAYDMAKNGSVMLHDLDDEPLLVNASAIAYVREMTLAQREFRTFENPSGPETFLGRWLLQREAVPEWEEGYLHDPYDREPFDTESHRRFRHRDDDMHDDEDEDDYEH